MLCKICVFDCLELLLVLSLLTPVLIGHPVILFVIILQPFKNRMFSTKSSADLLTTKKHFEVLDGLRGVAAIGVVIFHFMEIIIPDPKNNFIAHAYLAVDFFFCLSGFVIAYAYDNRLEKIGAWQFFKLRLIRLHPLVVIGSILGLLTFIFDPFSSLFDVYSGKAFLMFVCSCLLIPYPLVQERYFNFFHLNPPTWSLFWEYVANIFYAFIFVKLRKTALCILTIIAAILLCSEAYRSGHLSVGWGGDNFTGGGIRVFYSFLGGMLVYRMNWIIKSKLGFFWLSLLLMIAFFIPFTGKIDYITDAVIILFYFPLLIALGAGARLTSFSHKVCTFSGNISYPLYMVHYPFIWMFFSYLEQRKPPMNEMILITCIGVILLIGFAYLVMIKIDIPVRAYLKDKMNEAAIKKQKAVNM